MLNQYGQLTLEQTLFYLVIAIFPAIFFMIYIYRNDDKEKEPPLLLLKCIIGGLLSVPIAIILEMISEQVVYYLFGKCSNCYTSQLRYPNRNLCWTHRRRRKVLLPLSIHMERQSI